MKHVLTAEDSGLLHGSGDKDAGLSRARELGQRSCYPEVGSGGNTLSHKTKQNYLSTGVFKKLNCLSR